MKKTGADRYLSPVRSCQKKDMTHLTEEQHNAQMADMKTFDEQMPCIGIFWYDPEEKSFFGVHKKEITPKIVEEAAKEGKRYLEYPDAHEHEPTKAAIKREQSKDFFQTVEREQARAQLKFKGDYTQVPRGRVAWNIDKFIVLVGHWAEPILDELTELIEQEFSLPYFEFVYDRHWDLGNGWSGDMK